MRLKRGRLDTIIELVRLTAEADAAYGSRDEGEWQVYARCYAEVIDQLPSRGERVANVVEVSRRPARVRFDYVQGVTSDMRVHVKMKMDGVETTSRVLEIAAGPAELGRRDGIELMCEELSTNGAAA